MKSITKGFEGLRTRNETVIKELFGNDYAPERYRNHNELDYTPTGPDNFTTKPFFDSMTKGR